MVIANQPINPLVNFQQNSLTVKTTKTMADDDISTFEKNIPILVAEKRQELGLLLKTVYRCRKE